MRRGNLNAELCYVRTALAAWAEAELQPLQEQSGGMPGAVQGPEKAQPVPPISPARAAA